MKMHTRFEWTNWTFGIWWGAFSRSRRAPNHFGIDIGPLEFVWEWGGIKRGDHRSARVRRA